MIAHGEDLRELLDGDAEADAIIDDWRTAPMAPVDRALCAFAEKLTATPGLMEASDVAALRDAGLSDEAIHDATQVVAYFGYINRIADGLGTDLEPGMPPKPRSWFPQPRPLPALARDVALELVEIERKRLGEVLRLGVAPYQERFVASTAISLAQAGFHPTLVPRAISASGAFVGFVMWERQDDALYVVRFLIDHRAQGLGLGTRALGLVLDHARTLEGVRRVTLTFVPAPGSPERFYRRLGFVATGAFDEDGEAYMELSL